MPRQEGKSAFLALGKHILGRAVGEIVAVLHRDDRHDALRPAQFLDADVREADVPDLALALQLGERVHKLFKRHLRVGCMQLIEIDTLQLQPSQALLAGGAQMLRSAVPFPGLTPRSHEPAFGRDDQAFRISVECFGNEPLVDLRPIGVGGIDEGDAELDSTYQHALRTRKIERLTPYPRAAQAHGAEPEAIHGRVATEGEAATGTVRPQPVGILTAHLAFLFLAINSVNGLRRSPARPQRNERRPSAIEPPLPSQCLRRLREGCDNDLLAVAGEIPAQ